jgi:hypothetical protein
MLAALNLFKNVGEAHPDTPSDEMRDMFDKKKKGSGEASAVLHDTIPEVRNHADKLHKAVVAAAAKPAVASTGVSVAASKRPMQEEGLPASSTKKRKAAEKPDPHSFKGRRAAKYFDKVIFYGTIDGFTAEVGEEEEFWHITYDDGDDEEYDMQDLKTALTLYDTVKHGSPWCM